ncbi:MAG: AsmA family protein, partial [Terriglobales bacterium]
MKRRSLVIGVAAVVLMALLVPMIGLPARSGILRSLERGLGRTVSAQSVHLRLLPLPGIELDQVQLAENPGFGLEDMVTADDAVATLRWLPLLRGRLVFARVHLDGANINLVRNADGRWNLAALLARESQPGAAGGGRSPAARFPYIEWSDSRVNFKLDDTKTRFYLAEVSGSLAREPTHNGGGDWRLQMRFAPQRSDLDLSGTGTVRLDGRWAVEPGGFRALPFQMTLRLDDSYLAASSALVMGHDAGLHGVLAAAVEVEGTSQRFTVRGEAHVEGLRRWDLNPPPAAINCNFTGVYVPARDEFDLTGLGDAGFQHARLQGVISGVLSHPQVQMQLELNALPAADLVPLAIALKSGVPPGLTAAGTVTGGARLNWSQSAAGAGGLLAALDGRGQAAFSGLQLANGPARLRFPTAAVRWGGQQLQLTTARGTLTAAGARAPVELSAALDRQGFRVAVSSPRLAATGAATLLRLAGLASPWPGALRGEAAVRWTLASPWNRFRQAAWTGAATLAQAVFAPQSQSAVPLQQVSMTWLSPQALDVHFTTRLVAAPVASASGAGSTPAAAAVAPGTPAELIAGLIQLRPGALPTFTLRARQLQAAALWRTLEPPTQGLAAGLLARVFGDPAPAWVQQLAASGSIVAADVDWHGFHAAMNLGLEAAPGDWRLTRLQLALAGGAFQGTGALTAAGYQIRGAVPATQPLALARLLRGTAFA